MGETGLRRGLGVLEPSLSPPIYIGGRGEGLRPRDSTLGGVGQRREGQRPKEEGASTLGVACPPKLGCRPPLGLALHQPSHMGLRWGCAPSPRGAGVHPSQPVWAL